MIIISLPDLAIVPSLPEGCTAALGFFDGVHVGHRAIIDAAIKAANENNRLPAVWMISRGGESFKGNAPLISTEEEKLKLLGKAGVRYAVLSLFEDIRDMDGRDFVKTVLKDTLRLSGVVCGFNFRFGKGASYGEIHLEGFCRELGMTCTVVPPVNVGNVPASSSLIRSLIAEGNVEEAEKFLGRPFSVELPVIRGKMLGRTLGFPTVNQLIPDTSVIPKRGVYAAAVTLPDGKVYPGAANIGVCPTVTNEVLAEAGLGYSRNPGAAKKDHPVCETYICGFSGDLYGKKIKICFLRRIRGEVKFDGVDDLSARIRFDAETAENVFNDRFINKNSNERSAE